MNERARFSYAVVTPVRNEEGNLNRLADSLMEQTLIPARWIVVDTGSTDNTLDVTQDLARRIPFLRVISAPPTAGMERGGPIVRAFNEGVEGLDSDADIVVKLDADVSMGASYFETLVDRFHEDQQLGIASGTCFEEESGVWRQRHVTGDHVWGASRAYRRQCLDDVSPLEERMGWDGIDVFKAKARGWRTTTFTDLPFRHHRGEGARDPGRFGAWKARGRAAHYMGYRPFFVILRALRYAVREPAALAMIAGWWIAALRRERRTEDPAVRSYLRRHQRLRDLPMRAAEALGRRPSS